MVSRLRQSIHITNPDFVPDEKMISTLSDAARRGVKVVLLIPGQVFEQDLANSRPVTYRDWSRQSLASRFLELLSLPLREQM
jgi:phosphatidylserine/phosphatidylglycerophosphate/cardiolipin synthase-like enzyme